MADQDDHTCDGEDLQAEARAHTSNDIEFHDGRWVHWINHYKEVIGATSVAFVIILGVINVLYMDCQVRRLSESDKTFAKQTNLLAEQVDALWYSNRPILRIHESNPKKDITEFIYHDTTLCYVLHLTLENVGPTPAIINSVRTQVVSDLGSYTDTTAFLDLGLSPKDTQSSELEAPLFRDKENYLKVVVTYCWDRADVPDEKFTLPKYMKIFYNDTKWHIYKIDAAKFDEFLGRHRK